MLAPAVVLVSTDVLAPVLLEDSLVAPIVEVLLELEGLVLVVSVELGAVVDAVLVLLEGVVLLVSVEVARDWSVVGSVVLLVLLEDGVVDELL